MSEAFGTKDRCKSFNKFCPLAVIGTLNEFGTKYHYGTVSEMWRHAIQIPKTSGYKGKFGTVSY